MPVTAQGSADSGFDQQAWDLATRFALRPEFFFDRLATVKPANQSMPGHTVRFTFTGELAAATTALTEKEDVTPVTFTDSNVDVVLEEYGNVVKTTAYLRGTSYIPLDPVVANLIGHNAGLSLDTIARDALMAGTNVYYGGDATTRGGSGTGLVAADTLEAADIRKVVAKLRGDNVPTKAGGPGLYDGFVHPDVSVDLRVQTDLAGWRAPHVYVRPDEIVRGEIGAFEGVRFVESPRMPIITDGGDGTADVYQSLIVGWEALAKAFASKVSGPLPGVVPGPVTDHLRRFVPMGWYWMGGYKILRDASVRRIETASSLGDNA